MQHDLQATSPLHEWLSYLEKSHFKTIDLGLERVKSVAEELNVLQPAPFVITVGGTNGKGTTCRLLETILFRAGYRVGVYSSPHLIRYNERVRIQNRELADSEHTKSFAFINQHKSQSLTYFEFSTLSALHLFKQAKLDVVILEVGLGGRLDATNIVDSDIAVITSIDIDHVDFLGTSREQIAIEKAGIFRAHKPVVIGEPDVPHTMLDYAEQLGCEMIRCNNDWQFNQQNNGWCWLGRDKKRTEVRLENLPFCRIPLPNAATALAVIYQLPFAISNQIIHQSLQETELTGRFQTIHSAQLWPLAKITAKNVDELPQVVIDVGHNPHAARYLSTELSKLKMQVSGKIIAVCGILKDKDASGVLSPLVSIIDTWYCVGLTGERGQTGATLFVTLQQIAQQQEILIRGESAESVLAGVKSAVEKSTKNDIVLVFGSFHTVGDFLQFLQENQ
ncbi:MAG TPA: bifunctional tetrahydrofolate synthase/dihydrofolate synthase [Pasteurellaceae bacterium]|nr:bifunctional tetrahydrofolate synthase/dihydrofolate synthase [Pasteurellaceae bacterium]